jgi:hypothetical protein
VVSPARCRRNISSTTSFALRSLTMLTSIDAGGRVRTPDSYDTRNCPSRATHRRVGA